MAERGHTSSMTSVTEYDSSLDSESDTTESTNSNVTSSILSSTDTDDKLTPSLNEISISAASQTNDQTQTWEEKLKQTGMKRPQPYGRTDGASSQIEQSRRTQDENISHCQPSKKVALNRRLRPQDRLLQSMLGRQQHHSHVTLNNNASCSSENLGIDDTDNKLSTDLSDTSSRAAADQLGKTNLSSAASQEDEGAEQSETDLDVESASSSSRSYQETQSWEPDMNSCNWYQARCFSRYWNHYGVVMAWYRAHMDAVRRLHKEMFGVQSGARVNIGHQASSNVRNNRRAKRARNRRFSKGKRKAAKPTKEKESTTKTAEDGVTLNSGDAADVAEGEGEQEMEMEITEDMLDFFKTSLKHRMERDTAKSAKDEGETECETRVNIEDAAAGQAGPSAAPPQERPGARRAQEMKQLYGTGAPMIHGMETALQMTFDRTQDKFQPKLWPNMPLKIVFG